MLDLVEVTVAFDALRAVDRVTLSVPRGQRRAVIGPNGAGKTTLFNAITGMILPTSGRVIFDGHDVTRLPPHRRARLGISRTFQMTNLFQTLSVEDNMMLAVRGLSLRKFSLFGRSRLDPDEQIRIMSALRAVRLPSCNSVPIRELSYGEQRQIEIAVSLVTQPRLLLLDEPAAGLSPAERSLVTEIICSLPNDITIVLIEHDMDLALGIADHVTCLHEGRVLVEESPEAIRSNEAVQKVYLGSALRA